MADQQAARYQRPSRYRGVRALAVATAASLAIAAGIIVVYRELHEPVAVRRLTTPARPARTAQAPRVGVVTQPRDPGGAGPSFTAIVPAGTGTVLADPSGYAVWCGRSCHRGARLTDAAGNAVIDPAQARVSGRQPVLAGLAMPGGRKVQLVLDRCAAGKCVPAGGGQFTAPGPDPRLRTGLYAASASGRGLAAVVEQFTPAGRAELYALACASARCPHPVLVRLGPDKFTASISPGASNVAVAATGRGGFVVAVTGVTPGQLQGNTVSVYRCAALPCRHVAQLQVRAGVSGDSLALRVTGTGTIMIAAYVTGLHGAGVKLFRCSPCTSAGASFTAVAMPVSYGGGYPGGPPPAIAFAGKDLLIAHQNASGSQLLLSSCVAVSCRASPTTRLLADIHDLFAVSLSALAGPPRVLWETAGPGALTTYLLACDRPLCSR